MSNTWSIEGHRFLKIINKVKKMRKVGNPRIKKASKKQLRIKYQPQYKGDNLLAKCEDLKEF